MWLQVVVIGMSIGFIIFVTALHIYGKVRRGREIAVLFHAVTLITCKSGHGPAFACF